MAKIRRSGLALPPGTFAGEVLTWDGVQWGPQALPPPPGSTPQQGDILIFNTITNEFVPASFLDPPANARQMFDVNASFAGQPDGTLVTTWPDISGNALDISNAGGAQRPSLITDSSDGVRALAFDGIANRMNRTAMAANASSEGTIFIVLAHEAVAGRVAVMTTAGAIFGGPNTYNISLSSTQLGIAARAHNLGGATMRGRGMVGPDDGTGGSAGIVIRRAYCFQWTLKRGLWGQISYLGDDAVFHTINAGAPANVAYTELWVGVDNTGALFFEEDVSYLSIYTGANSTAIGTRRAWMELKRLQAKYNCL